jgi:hypothetical protein
MGCAQFESSPHLGQILEPVVHAGHAFECTRAGIQDALTTYGITPSGDSDIIRALRESTGQTTAPASA